MCVYIYGCLAACKLLCLSLSYSLACRLSLSAHRPCSQVAFLGKLLADAASQSYKSYSGHLWMFSKHRGELRVCVCMCMHVDWDLWPRAVPGSNASAFFFFLEKRRLKISLAFFPLFLLCSFLALRLLQIRQCVKNLAGCVRVSSDVWNCISGLGLVGFFGWIFFF